MSMLDERTEPLAEVDGVLNEALVLAAEVLGLRAAVQLRSEIRSLSSAHTQRLVVVSEPDQQAVEAITALIGVPHLAPTLNALPRVHTTYRFGASSAVLLTTAAGEQEMLLDGRGASADDVAAVRDAIPGRLLQVDVRLPAPFLSRFAVVHLPDLHAAGSPVTPRLSLTPATSLAYVKRPSAPLSAAEIAFLGEATRHAAQSALLLTAVDRYPRWPEVAVVNDELLGAVAPGAARMPSIVVGEQDSFGGLDELRGWLQSGAGSGAPIIESLDLARNVAVATLAKGADDHTSPVGDEVAANLQAAEVDAAQLAHGATTWLPRLAYEFTRVRSELGERTSQALAQLEQRNEQWIQSDVARSTRGLPAMLLEGLRSVSRMADEELVSRLDAVADQFLGGRSHQFVPGGMSSHIAPADVDVRLMDVSRMHVDPRTELFAGLGNFGSGRQSLGLVSSFATALSAPIALVGGVIGLGFWRVGRQSRHDGQARLHASRWLKIQVAEAGRVLRYRIDQGLNQGQLALNLAVRDYYDRAGADARQSVDAARRCVAEAEAAQQQRALAMTARAGRAERLIERSETLRDVVALVPQSGPEGNGRAGDTSS